jgi:hypothetical protein
MIDWTPILDWLLQHGTRILVILLMGIGLNLVSKKSNSAASGPWHCQDQGGK